MYKYLHHSDEAWHPTMSHDKRGGLVIVLFFKAEFQARYHKLPFVSPVFDSTEE